MLKKFSVKNFQILIKQNTSARIDMLAILTSRKGTTEANAHNFFSENELTTEIYEKNPFKKSKNDHQIFHEIFTFFVVA